MYFSKTPQLLQNLFPDLLCRIPGEEKVVYLTFDDGPTEGVTEEVLDLLTMHNAKATFFCLGRQVHKYPELYERIIGGGHRIGNHGYSHFDGWRTPTSTYLGDVERAEDLIKTDIFRPPYGRMRPAQYQALRQRYQLVLWDVMPGDFMQDRTPADCYKVLNDYTAPGSIVVLHDSNNAYPRLREILPRFLEEFTAKGYTFEALR
ncbi:polysaccharide deacetylase family protein [soil metagenome]